MRDISTPLVTSGARRGCGYRQPGGAYFAVPLGPGGRPVEELSRIAGRVGRVAMPQDGGFARIAVKLGRNAMQRALPTRRL